MANTMKRPRLQFRHAVQATALNLVQIRNTWRSWYQGVQSERARQYAEQQKRGS